MASFNITFIDNQQVVNGVPQQVPNYKVEVMSGNTTRVSLFELDVNVPNLVEESSLYYGQRESVLLKVTNLADSPLDIVGITTEGTNLPWTYYAADDYWYSTILPQTFINELEGKDIVVKVAPYDEGVVPEPLPTISVSQYLVDKWSADNFCLKVDGVEIVTGGEYSGEDFKFETIGNYVFEYIGTLNQITELWDYLVLSEGGRVATLSDTNTNLSDLQYSLKLSEDVEPEPDPLPTISVTQNLIDSWSAGNFHLEVDGVRVEVGGDYPGEVFTFVADGNYVFVSLEFLDTVMEITTYLELSPNRKVGYLPSSMVEEGIHWPSFSYELELSEEVDVDVRGANTVFRVSDEALKEITHRRFEYPTSSSNIEDYGQFILGLIELPFDIPEEYVVGTERVRLGKLNTEVMGDVLSRDRIQFNLGNIEVVGEYSDARDYQGVEVVLHLPFAESVDIAPEYVIGQTIGIVLSVSLYDGTADYMISSTFSDGWALSQKVSLEVDVPFANVENVPSRNNPNNMLFGIDNGITTAYVEVKRQEALLADSMFSAPVVVEESLGAQSGYIEVEEVRLDVECTSVEAEMLQNVLRGGVIIDS